jgi:uncharacterized protein YaeQ
VALKATIFKANLSVANMNIHHYCDYNLTMARHPSENSQRMMYRLVAYALLSQENPEFTKGLSTDSEPELWCHNYGGEIEHWVELGQPDEKRIRQACGKAKKVSIFTYQENTADSWLQSIESKIWRFEHLNITHLSKLDGDQFEDLVERSMNLSCNIQDNEAWISSEKANVGVSIRIAKAVK